MRHKFLLLLLFSVILLPNCAHSAEPPRTRPRMQVTSVSVSGNAQIPENYILRAVNTKPGTIISRDVLQADVEAIYNQGFFSFADFDFRPDNDGVAVTFTVTENPKIESINFIGNTIYTTEQLMPHIFSVEGVTFNRRFFRSDLDRIQEKYHKDGYVMARVSDVQIDIIQGNTKTKTYVIRREIKLKEGDFFNVIHFRHQLGKLQGLGYFEDVNVAFDIPEGSDDIVDLVLTVKEKRTASVGINLGYGSESGMSGGLTYNETNMFGRGMELEVGFNEGDEASYWATFSSTYMDSKTYAWRIGARYWTYDDRYYYRNGRRQFEFDEKVFSVFASLGRKFSNEDWSWWLTLRHQKAEYDDVHNAIPGYIDDMTEWDGTNQTVELRLTWDKRDVYASYPSGFVWDTYLEQAVEALGGEYSYLKYWGQARFYASLNEILSDIVDTKGTWTDENPFLFAARLRIGSSTEDELPSFARYSLGGISTLRGYNSRSFEGTNFYLGNFELRIPVNNYLSLVGFYDVGNADKNLDWDNSHDDYGIGIRVKTPFGTLRLDHAKGEDENRTYFGFGEMF